ncbi:MAG: peptidylprolyl isomerase [Bacteroidales bacterium]|jgi:peptidyl-prolyl cis-trans isomerase SurA|nr:peptidylprolyl isomerase [Bacteroidales bacterium]
MKKICLIICSFLMTYNSFSQELNNKSLIKIDDKEISKEEFQRIYDKNKTNISTGEVTSVNDYLDLFINFKLKVFEAEKLGLDTFSAFLNEFEGYKKQLASPYLVDNSAIEKIIKEAYERMQFEVRASHILIKIPNEGFPVDTLSAYTKAMDIRRRILKGESFESVAKGSSNDPSVKNNGGDLGYFTVFQMIYPFETAVFNSEIGEISKPVRTRFGYHIVKVTDKREARGQIKVAHIMLTVPRGISPEVENQKKQLINELYHKLKQGNEFNELAKEYSDDKGSARNGGELPWFGAGRMVPEFEKASFNLKIKGEVSQPIKTSFGWHIIKRIDRKEIPSFDDAVKEITSKVGKDQRVEIARESFINKLKLEYNFIEEIENNPVKHDTIENVYILNPDYIIKDAGLNKTLFSFLNNVYTEKDFADFVESKRGNKELKPFSYKILFDEFVENKILEVENSRLEEKYPEYKYILKEYHDGMLLFEITDQKIWSKAVSDSVGLKKFYNDNRKSYMWDERWNGTLYYCSNYQVYEKVLKIVSKNRFGKKITNKDLLKQFNIETEVLKIETRIFEKEENEIVDYFVWNKKIDNKKIQNVCHKGVRMASDYKEFNECRGLVISDYQDYLDKEWIKALREKYNIQINDTVLSTINK